MEPLRGKIVFASGRSTDFHIWSLDVASGELRQLTEGEGHNDFPRFSRDGKRIAFISTGSDYVSRLALMNADGTKQELLTKDVDIHCSHPCWAPDGQAIVFVGSVKGSDEFEIHRFDLRSRTVTILFRRVGHETEPCISPDGQMVLFSSIDPNSTIPFSHRDTEIWERDLSSGRERKICEHPMRDYGPVYSPDGSKIAFISHRNGRTYEEVLGEFEKLKAALDPKDRQSIDRTISALQKLTGGGDIYVVNRDGTNLRQLTDNVGLEEGVRWSPCGKYLVFSAAPRGEEQSERLMVLNVVTGETDRLHYDRSPLERSIGVDRDEFVNRHVFEFLIPNFIERPLKMMWLFRSMSFGEEQHPDWTYAD